MRSLRAEGLSIRDIAWEAGAGTAKVTEAVSDMPVKIGRPALYQDPKRNRLFLAAWDAAEWGDRHATAMAFGFKTRNAAAVTAYRIRKGKLPS